MIRGSLAAHRCPRIKCEDISISTYPKRSPICGLPLDRPRITGILNATPDSFSDGGAVTDVAGRVAEIVAEGADIVDIGGESTRPGAETVPVEEEWRRVAPAIEAAVATGTVVSIDTRKAEIARRALKAGARLFNDVSALTYDEGSLAVARGFAEAGGAVCLMHALGDPKTMQKNPHYDDVLREVHAYLARRIVDTGLPQENLIVDPGIGFGKTLDHNLTLLRSLGTFHDLGCPILLGASRKGFIGKVTGDPVAANRVHGSVAAALKGVSLGVQILRVHDVRATAQALSVWTAIEGAT